jgi:hypothetical protein
MKKYQGAKCRPPRANGFGAWGQILPHDAFIEKMFEERRWRKETLLVI